MDIYKLLDKLNINYQEELHDVVKTIEEADRLDIKIEGIGCKNLFLKDKNNKYYLVMLKEDKRCNLKELSNSLETKHLSFGSILELRDLLGLEEGSVTPLGIINDIDNLVEIVIDKELVNSKLLVHPNRNDRTINLNYTDLIKIIEYLNHKYILLDM